MRFLRLGRLFQPTGRLAWARSHASTPFGMEMSDGTVRVYFTSRDDRNRSHIGSVNLAVDGDAVRVVGPPRLELSPGPADAFDEHGVAVGSVVEVNGDEFLYYLGWKLSTVVPWTNTIGLAVRRDGDTQFRKYGPGPVLDVSPTDPHSLSYPWVARRGDEWAMWYGTNLSWGPTPDDMEHAVRRATSTNGLHWRPDAELSLDVERPEEYALARPCVFPADDGRGALMFVSARVRSPDGSYEIALARSGDALVWTRDQTGVEFVGPREEWESQMMCYAAPIQPRSGALYIVYCGNRFGATGFGLARHLRS